MSLIKGFSDSMAADPTTNYAEDTGPSGNPAYLGYVKFPFPAQMPAQDNGAVGITKDIAFTNVNQGTNLDSYSVQKAQVDAETGASGK